MEHEDEDCDHMSKKERKAWNAAKRAALEPSTTNKQAQPGHPEAVAKEAVAHEAAKTAPDLAKSAVPKADVVDAVEAKVMKQLAKRAAAEAAAAQKQPTEDEQAEAKRLRKAAKRAATETSAPEEQPNEEEQAAEAKRLRKAAKRAALEDTDATEKPKQKAQDVASSSPVVRSVPLSAEEIDERSKKRKERKKQEKEGKKTRADNMTVFVSGIHCDKNGISEHFGGCGEIDFVKVLLDNQGKPRGLAYISYKTEAAAEAALKLDETKHNGKHLSVKPSKPKLKDCSDFEVFVKHFPREDTDEALRKVFAACGPIDKLKIPRWEDGAAKGMAFIIFKDFRSVRKALELNGKKVGEKWIEVKKSDRTDASKKKDQAENEDGSKVDEGDDGKSGKAGKGKGKGSKGGKNGKSGKGKGKGGKNKDRKGKSKDGQE